MAQMAGRPAAARPAIRAQHLSRQPGGAGPPTPPRPAPRVLPPPRPLAKPGAAVASLSIPWGFSKGDDDLGGYHLVWPRDLVETAGGFLAVGARHPARGRRRLAG